MCGIGYGWAMNHENDAAPGRPLEEWTDSEVIEQYRYLAAETEDMDVHGRDEGPLDVLDAELRRRGLETDVEGDAASPGREQQDPAEGEA